MQKLQWMQMIKVKVINGNLSKNEINHYMILIKTKCCVTKDFVQETIGYIGIKTL